MMFVHALTGAESTSGPPVIRTIGVMDLKDALARGMSDFSAMPTHALFLCLIYPIVGLILARVSFGHDVLSLLFPLAAGFALLGPFVAIGFYELSRQREQGLDISWADAFDVLHSPSRDAIAALGLLLLVIFVFWIGVAEAIYIETFGHEPAASIPNFVREVFTTPAGWTLIIVGNGIGFLFALAVLIISVVSFPLLLDRDVGAVEAVLTSVRAVAANPAPMAGSAPCRCSSASPWWCRCSVTRLGTCIANSWSRTRTPATNAHIRPKAGASDMPHSFRPRSSAARSRQRHHRLNQCSTRQPVGGELHERAAQRSLSLASPRERSSL